MRCAQPGWWIQVFALHIFQTTPEHTSLLKAYDFTIYCRQIRAAAVGPKPVRGFAFACFKMGDKDIGVYSGNHGLPDATVDFIFTKWLTASQPTVTQTSASDHLPLTRNWRSH